MSEPLGKALNPSQETRLAFGGWKTALAALAGLSVVWAVVSGLLWFGALTRAVVCATAALIAGAAAVRTPRQVAAGRRWEYFLTAGVHLSFAVLVLLVLIIVVMEGSPNAPSFCSSGLEEVLFAVGTGVLGLVLVAGARRYAWLSVQACGRQRRALAVSLLVAVALAFAAFAAWSTCVLADLYPFSYVATSVDIRSGKLLVVRRFLGLPAGYEVQETPVSKQLANRAPPEWRSVYVHHPFAHVHTIYHGAANQTWYLEPLWKEYDYPVDAQRKSASDLVYLWQRGGDYRLAGDYLGVLMDPAFDMRAAAGREAFFKQLMETQPDEMVTEEGAFRWLRAPKQAAP